MTLGESLPIASPSATGTTAHEYSAERGQAAQAEVQSPMEGHILSQGQGELYPHGR